MNVYLIRHGETDVNRAKQIQGRGINAPLNDLGKKQAREVAQALDHIELDLIVASSLIRTHQTAEPLVSEKGKFKCYEELDELSFGEFEGRNFEEIRNELMHIHDQWSSGNIDYPIPGGESPIEAFDRASSKVHEILNEQSYENIAFVLHGRLLRILLSEWLGYGLKNMHEIKHVNGSINHIKWIDRSFKAVQLNRTDHLSDYVIF